MANPLATGMFHVRKPKDVCTPDLAAMLHTLALYLIYTFTHLAAIF